MLKVRKQAKIEFEGKPLEISPNQLGDFLLGSVSERITLEEGVTMSEIMNIFYHLKGFVSDYYLEEYEGLNALVSSGVVIEPISKIVIYKELIVSPEGETIFIPKIRTENNEKIEGYFDLKLEIDPNVKIIDESGRLSKDVKLLTHVTLLELLGAVFVEFQDYITKSAGTH